MKIETVDRYTHPQEHIDMLERRVASCITELNEVEQILGRALNFPRYCDDPKNFPNATEADGVCVGDLTPAILAQIAADRITSDAYLIAKVLSYVKKWREEISSENFEEILQTPLTDLEK